MNNRDMFRGFMPHRERDSEYPVSRDWKHVDCLATGCMFNRNLSCSVPSRAQFDETAHCTGFVAGKIDNKKIDGD